MDLTFWVPLQYCSLHHRTLVSPPDTSTPGYCFPLWLSPFVLSGAISLLFSSNILGTYQPGEFIFQCHTFLPFHTVHGVLKQECSSGLPFPPAVDHVLSELSTVTRPSWATLHNIAHSLIELV